MKINLKATSIAESMVIMLVVTTWIIWAYSIFNQSMKLSENVENRIRAISIAREWIEAVTNIRDTNWLLFSSDKKNCWNTLNYNSSCISDTSTTQDIPNNSHFVIYQDSNSRWNLQNTTTTTYSYENSDYRDKFKVWIDNLWFHTQTWAVSYLNPVFTREIKINYVDTNWWWTDSNDEKMQVTSVVYRRETWRDVVHKVELNTNLVNWKE